VESGGDVAIYIGELASSRCNWSASLGSAFDILPMVRSRPEALHREGARRRALLVSVHAPYPGLAAAGGGRQAAVGAGEQSEADA
jgi:hypothetical protein